MIKPQRNGRNTANDVLKALCGIKKCTLLQMSMNFVPESAFDNKSSLVHAVKQFPEAMLTTVFDALWRYQGPVSY